MCHLVLLLPLFGLTVFWIWPPAVAAPVYLDAGTQKEEAGTHPHRAAHAGIAPSATQGTDIEYTCPMHPQVRQPGPGSCPECGMALEPASAPIAAHTQYVCPMHPEVMQDHPGNCPKCGMALEPRTVQTEEDDSELRDMSRRFRVSAILAIPVFLSAMTAELWPQQVAAIIDPKLRQWLELILATPAVLWPPPCPSWWAPAVGPPWACCSRTPRRWR